MYSLSPPPNRLPSLPGHADLRALVEPQQSSVTSDRPGPSVWPGSATSFSPSKPLDRDDYSHHHHHHHHQRQRLHDRSQAAPYPPPHGSLYEGNSDGTSSPVDSGSAARPVIPSKRAAQNRAAQRAFRQRRDKYVKDLERKVKEMEGWTEEMEQLRSENKQLRDSVAVMSQRMAELTGQTPTSMMSSSSASSIGSVDIGQHCQQQQHHHRRFLVEAAPITVTSPPTSPPDHLPTPTPPPPVSSKAIHSIPSVPLRTPSSFSAAPAVNSRNDDGDGGGSRPIMEQHANRAEVWAFDNFDLEFAFDSYFQDETMPITAGADDCILQPQQQQQQQQQRQNMSGQVLDNLFEMLQTRQRPQIPAQYSPRVHPHAHLPLQTASYVMPLHPSASCHR